MKSKLLIVLRVAIIVLCIVWQGVIYGLSAENSSESGDRSQGICEQIAEIVLRGDEDTTQEDITALADTIEPPLRSLAHMFCYAVLGGLYFLLFASFGLVGLGRSVISVGCTLVYAVFDEIHQIYVPGRSFQLSDICVDTLGALLAVCVLSIILRTVLKRRKKNENSNSR